MQVYSGCDWRTSSTTWLKATGLGQLRTTPHWQPPVPGIPWGLDNGAFTLFRRAKGERYDTTMGKRFAWILNRIDAGLYHPVDFAIVPDIVASRSSLDLSLRWLGRLPSSVPPYLAVQNGMTSARIRSVLRDHSGTIRGLFVGGTIEWKDATAAAWAALAHEHGLKCHVGRVGMPERICAMLEAGVDSIDSTSWAQHYSHKYIVEGFEKYAQKTGKVPAVLKRMRRLPLPSRQRSS